MPERSTEFAVPLLVALRSFLRTLERVDDREAATYMYAPFFDALPPGSSARASLIGLRLKPADCGVLADDIGAAIQEIISTTDPDQWGVMLRTPDGRSSGLMAMNEGGRWRFFPKPPKRSLRGRVVHALGRDERAQATIDIPPED